MPTDRISYILKAKRKQLGLSVNEVLSRLQNEGVDISSPKTIYGWENGHRQPDADTFLVLCRIYNILSLKEIDNVAIPPTDITAEAHEVAQAYDKADLKNKNIARQALDLPTLETPAPTTQDKVG